MYLKSLKLENWRSYKTLELSCQEILYICGLNKDTNDGNGCGKSAIVEGIKYSLYGSISTPINVGKFIRKGEKKASVETIWEVKDNEIKIIREVPNSLQVWINGEEIKGETATDTQKILNDHIDSWNDFKQFRLVDKDKGVNILDFTPGQLRKSLMSLWEDKFDGMRKKLTAKKAHFEKFNKSAVVHKFSPSEKRLQILTNAIKELDTTKLKKIQQEIIKHQREKSKLLGNRGSLGQEKDSCEKSINRLKKMNECWACYQKVPDQHKQEQIERLNKQLRVCLKKIQEIVEQLKIEEDILKFEDNKQKEIYKRKDKLSQLCYKLKTRVAQKEYCFTKEDVEIAKLAIEEIDQFANYYILEWVKTIEPIVNGYISVLCMKVHFDIDKKGNPSLKIVRANKEFDYDELSAGEKIFVSFLFKIALLLEQGKNGILIADEGLSELSAENIQRVIQVVKGLPIQLFLISHNVGFQDKDIQTIFVTKEKDISYV